MEYNKNSRPLIFYKTLMYQIYFLFYSQGTYTWTDFALDPTDVAVPAGMEGLYQLDVILLKEEEPSFCFSVELEISM